MASSQNAEWNSLERIINLHTLLYTVVQREAKWIATINSHVISVFKIDAYLANGCCLLISFPLTLIARKLKWAAFSGIALNFTEIDFNENSKKKE